MVNSNIDTKLREISSTFNLWKTRGLTLGGRICLTKVFGIPKLNLILQVLSIPEECIKRIEQILYNFVWKGKTDKVKRKVLISNYDKGGLKMLDIRSIIKKFQLCWIQRYFQPNESNWKNIFDEYLRPFGGLGLLVHCNYDLEEIKKETNSFLTAVLETWKHFYCKFQKPSQNFIWNNQNVKIGNKTIYYSQFLQAGMWYISDLFNDTGEPIAFQIWENRGVEKKHFFKWIGIISCLRSKEIHQLEKPTPTLSFQLKGKLKHLSQIASREFYEFLLSEISEPGPSNKTKMEQTLGPLDWKEIFMLPRKVSTDPKLHELQFKINHNILATNSLLYRCKIKNSDICDICHLDKENIQHLFWDCLTSKNLFLKFHTWWIKMTKLTDHYQQITKRTAIFGLWGYKPGIILYNHFLLLIKQYIWKNKAGTIHFDTLLCIFRNTRAIESYIAKKKGKTKNFLDKWQCIQGNI